MRVAGPAGEGSGVPGPTGAVSRRLSMGRHSRRGRADRHKGGTTTGNGSEAVHAHHGLVEMLPAHGAAERRVAVAEDATVRRDEPVALAVAGGLHRHDWRIEVDV